MTFLAVKLTPAEESEGQCGDCGISFVDDIIHHKYLNCSSEAARQSNLKELFSKIKLKEAGREKMDRLMLAIFKKKDEEDPSFVEKLLQQSREKPEVPGLTRKSRRLSGNIVPPQRRTKEENMEMMIQDLHCPQCHRTYKDQAKAKDDKENKHHFCYVIGNLKSSPQIDPTPTPTKKAKLCCTFCPQLKNIVFRNSRELMKHLVLAHKTKFFIEEIKKQNVKKGLAKEDLKCFVTKCNVKSASLEDHLIHIGVDHEKLFNALMHDKKNNLKNVAKELFPKKYKEHSHDWGRGSAGSSQKVAKRNLDRVEADEGGPMKKVKFEEEKVVTKVETPSQLPGPYLKPEPGTDNSSSEAQPRRMKREVCEVCKETQSNKVTLYNHLAGKHFSEEINRKYPGTANDREKHYPCTFPGCSEVFHSALARVHHLGRPETRGHGLVDQCLAAREAAKTKEKEEKKPKQKSVPVVCFKCRICSEEFATKQLRQVHSCHSLLAKPPAGDRRTSLDDVYYSSKTEKDISGDLTDASVDSSELNEAVGDLIQRMEYKKAVEEEEGAEENETKGEGEGDPWRGQTCGDTACRRKDCVVCVYCGRRHHKREHRHLSCEAKNCNHCFPTEKLRSAHFSSFGHTFEDL